MTERSAKPSPASRLRTPIDRAREAVGLWQEAGKAARYDNSIFIWIPKNAGTSVHSALRGHGFVKLKTPRSVRLSFRNRGRVTFGHMAVGSLVDLGLVQRNYVDRAFKFAFSRDPYDRAVSLYRYLSETFVIPNWHGRPTFQQFLQLLADGFYDRIGPYNTRGLSQCSPQSDWLRDTPPDKIYRFEDMAEFAEDISGRLRIDRFDMPHLNKSGDNSTANLSLEEKALIEQIYAEDFATLGYPKR